jgi:5-methylcytosine-specific restriction endonuclease McrA
MSNWRDSIEYRVWRAEVIRGDSRCAICSGLVNREAHHLNHASYFPLERFDVANGITLCKSCHRQFHTNFKTSTREKCTLEDFLNFQKLVSYIKGLL